MGLRKPEKPNRKVVINGHAAIEMTLTKGRRTYVLESDHHIVAGRNWYAVLKGGNWYAACGRWSEEGRRHGAPHKIFMHRMILGASDPKTEVDHIDRDSLNNMRHNLRAVTHQQNCYNMGMSKNNKHGIKGISPHGRGWAARAQVTIDGVIKNLYLGTFDTPREAGAAYDNAVKKYRGKFGFTNEQ